MWWLTGYRKSRYGSLPMDGWQCVIDLLFNKEGFSAPFWCLVFLLRNHFSMGRRPIHATTREFVFVIWWLVRNLWYFALVLFCLGAALKGCLLPSAPPPSTELCLEKTYNATTTFGYGFLFLLTCSSWTDDIKGCAFYSSSFFHGRRLPQFLWLHHWQ